MWITRSDYAVEIRTHTISINLYRLSGIQADSGFVEANTYLGGLAAANWRGKYFQVMVF